MKVTRGILVFLMSSVCWAGATLTMGFGSDSDCNTPDNCAFHPNVGMSESFSIFQGGSKDVPPPVLLILGVANDTTGSLFVSDPVASMSTWTSFDPANPTANKTACSPAPPDAAECWSFVGGSVLGSYGFRGNYTGAGGLDVYTFLGLTGGNNSNHFANWAGFLSTEYGQSASSFGIYVLALNRTLEAGGLLEVQFQTAIPDFTYLAGYAVDTTGSRTKYYSSPFTRTGLQVSVPEPSFWAGFGVDMLILGIGMAVLSYKAKQRRKSQLREPVLN